MGLVTSGIPQAIVQRLADLSQAEVFIETGTFQGATARWAANVFATVHTIELAKVLYDEHHAALAAIPGIQPHFGDSAEVLPRIVNDLPEDQSLVCWLDGALVWRSNSRRATGMPVDDRAAMPARTTECADPD